MRVTGQWLLFACRRLQTWPPLSGLTWTDHLRAHSHRCNKHSIQVRQRLRVTTHTSPRSSCYQLQQALYSEELASSSSQIHFLEWAWEDELYANTIIFVSRCQC